MEINWHGAGWWYVKIGEMTVRLAPITQVAAKLTLAKRAWNKGEYDESFVFFWSAVRAHDSWLKDNPDRIIKQEAV